METSHSSLAVVAKLTEGRCAAEDCAEVVVYGLELFHNGKAVACIHDISPDCGKVSKLVSLCNKFQVTEETVWDVVEDYLD